MSKLETLFYRGDTKWSHPELTDLYATVSKEGQQMPNASETFLNDKKYSFEERKAMVQKMDALYESMFPAQNPDNISIYHAKGCEEEPDAPEIEIKVVFPTKRKKSKMPCLYFITGGGLYSCLYSLVPGELLAEALGCVVVIVKYRTIYTGGGYPQTVNDCHACYKWILEHAEELNINPDKIVIMGSSSGSQMAMALSHRLKKYNYYGYEPRGVIAVAAITDDRISYPSCSFDCYGWNTHNLDDSSRLWLGDMDREHIPAEAFPNHATAEECIGLPPTFIHCDEHDSSCDADSEYASKLRQAGVYTEMHVWGGSNHAILTIALDNDCDYACRYKDVLYGNIRDCFKYDLRRKWTAEA